MRSVVHHLKTIFTVTVIVLIAISILAQLPDAMLWDGVLLAVVLAGVTICLASRIQRRRWASNRLVRRIGSSLMAAKAKPVVEQISDAATCIAEISQHPDALFREAAMQRIGAFSSELKALQQGELRFSSTETWRATYDRLLASSGVDDYFSAAWIRHEFYWQDRPAQRSLELQYAMIQRGLRVHRMVVVSERLWPEDTRLPAASVMKWLGEQKRRGVRISLVRETDLKHEEGLLEDFGIYGTRAVGFQELDDSGNTSRFILRFDKRCVADAREKWERLSVYAVAIERLLDRAAVAA